MSLIMKKLMKVKMLMFTLIGYLNISILNLLTHRVYTSIDPQFCPSTLAFILRVSHPPIVRIWHH